MSSHNYKPTYTTESLMKEYQAPHDVIVHAINVSEGQYSKIIEYLNTSGYASEADIRLVMAQTTASYDESSYAVKIMHGDLLGAILWLMNDRSKGYYTKRAKR